MLAIHILCDHRCPLVVQIPRQFELHGRIVYRNSGGHDQQVAILAFPQRVDYTGHQSQYTTRPLEFVQRGPVVVQPVEQLRMDRVGHLQPAFVIAFTAFRGKLIVLRAVHVHEGPGDCIACHERFLVSDRLE